MAGYKGEASEVKFPSLVKKWVIDVLLKDHSPVTVTAAVRLKKRTNFRDVLLNFDTRTSV